MPKATLQSALQNNLTVNRETRVVSGVKCMENNRDVTYKGADGKPIGFRTNDGLIDGLIGHAGNRTIPAHLTHDWTDGKKDALHSRVGGVKNFRRDETGALLADYHAMPGVEGDKILWLAENDPEHAMLSLVFDYNKIESNGVTYAVPLNFESADFVAKGAAVSAMLSQLQTDTDMTKEEIQTLISEAVKAALAEYKPAGYITKDEAKAQADEAVKAALSAHKVSDDDKKEIALLAQAETVKSLGATTLIAKIGEDKKNADSFEGAIQAQLAAGAKDRGQAIYRVAKDKPEIYNAALAAGTI